MLNKLIRRIRRKVFGIPIKINKEEYSLNFEKAEITDHAYKVARTIRGGNRGAGVLIHGVMPRSGTVFTGELLNLHPDLHGFPNNIYEVPFLRLTGDIKSTQEAFFNSYKRNREQMGESDFLPIFGASLMAYLTAYIPSNKRLLIKVPDVRYLNYFKDVFPGENLLILMRDGRDIVSSTLKTWPERKFPEVCERWDLSTKMALKCKELYRNSENGFLLARFEDVVADPKTFVLEACACFNLDSTLYPFDKIDEIQVVGSSTQKKDGKATWSGMEKTKDFNPVGRWSSWSEYEKATFKKIAGETLIKSGYCDNLDW